MKMIAGHSCAFAAIALLASSCRGTRVPEIREFWDGRDGTVQMEFEIKKRVFCDLRNAVQAANRENGYEIRDKKTGTKRQVPFIPDDWGAQVALALQVDESSTVSPGLVITNLRPNYIDTFPNGPVTFPQSFTLGANASAVSTATRIDRFNLYYTVERLMEPNSPTSACLPENDPFRMNGERPASSSFLLVGDLGIEKWLSDAMFTNSLLPSNDPAGSPAATTPDTITLEIKFVVATSGNINPTWR